MAKTDTATVDVRVRNHGTVWTFTPLTDAAREWVREHVDAPDYMIVGPETFAADWRPGRDIARGMEEDGLILEGGYRG